MKKYNIKIGDEFLLNNKQVITIIEYRKAYYDSMPYKSNAKYKTGGENGQWIYYDSYGQTNYYSKKEYEFEEQITKETHPECYL